MKPEVLRERMDSIENSIRSGVLKEARAALEALVKVRLPRQVLAEVSSFARRCFVPQISVRLLNPIVRSEKVVHPPPSPLEIAEYGIGLIRLGAVPEGLRLLEQLDPAKSPESLLYRSLGLVTQWEYSATIPLLEQFIASASVAPYQKLVGRVNLAAALVFERRTREADTLLEELRAETFRDKHRLLHANVLGFGVQNLIAKGEWDRLDPFLQSAEKAFAEIGGLEAFFVKKWRMIHEARENRGRAKKILESLRAEAFALRHWETVRECDLFQSTFTKDEALFAKLAFGTPFPAYRRRMEQEFGRPVEVPETFDWQIGSAGDKARSFSLVSGNIDGKKSDLRLGLGTHRLLVALAGDFYRPARIAALHHQIFSGEYYNPVTSPMRVHIAINRFRHWARERKLSLTVEEHAQFYSLFSARGCLLEVARGQQPEGRVAAGVQLLRDSFAGESFSAADAARILGKNARSVQRLLQPFLQEGTVTRSGAGPATRYQFLLPVTPVRKAA